MDFEASSLTLALVDETVVREEASKSMSSIAEYLNEMEIQNVFAPLLMKLAQSEWFTGRVTACSLFRACYAKAGPLKDRLRK